MTSQVEEQVDDLGWLMRRDRGDGRSDLLDVDGKVVATVETDRLVPYSDNLQVRRFRLTSTPG